MDYIPLYGIYDKYKRYSWKNDKSWKNDDSGLDGTKRIPFGISWWE